MVILPTHKTLPDTSSYGHPANTITVIAQNGITANNVQLALEEIVANGGSSPATKISLATSFGGF